MIMSGETRRTDASVCTRSGILAKDGKLLEYANQYHGNEMQKAGVAERLARIEAVTRARVGLCNRRVDRAAGTATEREQQHSSQQEWGTKQSHRFGPADRESPILPPSCFATIAR